MEISKFSDTKLKLKLGDASVPLSFGIYTRRRIEERHPGFDIFSSGGMADFEILPFLIQCAVEPEDQTWSTEKEFIELYENCTDLEALDKIPLAYQNSLGFTNQRFAPLIQKMAGDINEAKAEIEKKSKKK